MKEIFTTITTTNVPQKVCVTGGGLFRFNSAVFWGYNNFNSNGSPANNASGVYLGTVSGRLPIVVPTGGSFSWTLPDKQQEDLNNFWVMGNQNDGTYCILY